MPRSLLGVGLVLCVAFATFVVAAPIPLRPADKLARGKKFAERGQVDLFVAATEAWNLKTDDERLWVPAFDLGRRLIKKADMTGERRLIDCPASFTDFATYKQMQAPTFTRVDVTYLRPDPEKLTPPVLYVNEAIMAPGVLGPTGIGGNLIVSRGGVQTEGGLVSSAVFANGDVTAVKSMSCLLIVCDGDVTLTKGHIGSCLVVARGNITAKRGAIKSVLVAGGKVTLGDDKEPAKLIRANIIKENEPNPLGYITFFELSTVGVEVKVADNAVRVSAVADGKAFAKAGVKVGDTVTEVNGKKPDSAESLRRLLRDALAIGDATVTLKRGDQTVTVKVTLPE